MTDRHLILLAEDLEDDAILLGHALKSARIGNPLHVVETGQEAIEYLSGQGRYGDRAEYPLPSLFLLDLKMPGLNGFDVLEWIQTQPHLATLPVIVLSASGLARDVNRVYELGATSFLMKPAQYDEYKVLAEQLGNFLLDPEVLPPNQKAAPKPGR